MSIRQRSHVLRIVDNEVCPRLAEFLKTELPGTKPHHGNSTSTWATVAAHGKAKVNVQPPQKSDKGNPFKLLRHVNDPEDDEDSENEQRADSPPSLSNPAAGATASTTSVSDLADEQDSVDKGVESVSSNLAEGTSEAACSVAAEVRGSGYLFYTLLLMHSRLCHTTGAVGI